MASSLSSLLGLWSPLPGVRNPFWFRSVFVEHTPVDLPTLYPALRDASRLAICTVGNAFFLSTRGRWFRAIGGVVALVGLLSRIALSPELLGRCGWHSKNCDPVSVLHVGTSWSLASLPSPDSHVSDPLAPYCSTLFSWHLACRPGWHPTGPHNSWHLDC